MESVGADRVLANIGFACLFAIPLRVLHFIVGKVSDRVPKKDFRAFCGKIVSLFHVFSLPMKNTLVASLLLLTVGIAQAETTVTLEGVHNCCKSCTNGIVKAGTSVKDVTVTAEGKTVTVVAKTKMGAKKAVEAILEAGYFGKSSEETAGTTTSSKTEKKLTEVTVTGAHLCCQKCVNAMTDAVKAVPGVTEYDIQNKAKTFTVKGEFTESDLLASMNKAGFHGTVK